MTGTQKIALLGTALLATHLVLRELRKRQPDVKYVDTVPLNYNAITLPPFGILIDKKQANNKALLDHENIHWQQYQRMGLLPYYFKYAVDYLHYGYDHHPMEIEARQNESEAVRMNYTEAVRSGTAQTVKNLNFRS
jgi:hypothetical protein